MKNMVKMSVFGGFLIALVATAATADSNADMTVEQILAKLNESTAEIDTYSSKITYIYEQPILDSQTLRTGNLFFATENDLTKLRINFETVVQDDGEPQRQREHYIFDGIWLAQLDYRTNSARIRQMAREDEPASAFELARQNFPIIGFDEVDQLRQDFEITLGQSEKDDTLVLELAVLEDSRYVDEYDWVEVSIEKERFLPRLIVAQTIEGDLYRIELSQAQLDAELEEGLFEIDVPANFSPPEIIRLD